MYYNTLHYFRDEDICLDLFERMAIRCAYVLFMWFNKLNERDVAEILLSVRGSVEPFNKNHKILKILQSLQPPEIQIGQLAGLWIECDAIFVQTLYGDGIFVLACTVKRMMASFEIHHLWIQGRLNRSLRCGAE